MNWEDDVTVKESEDGWLVVNTAYDDEVLAGPFLSSQDAFDAMQTVIQNHHEEAYERQMVGDRDFTPPYEP